MVEPATHGFGLFGEDFGYPGGGLCISAFVIPRQGRHVLVGQMAEHPRWEAEWAPNLVGYAGEIRARAFSGLRFPGTYLREGEAFDDAALRVLRDQLDVPGEPALPGPRMLSAAGPSRRHPGRSHWDILALYELRLDIDPLRKPPHWARLEWRDLAELRADEMVMLHGELLQSLSTSDPIRDDPSEPRRPLYRRG